MAVEFGSTRENKGYSPVNWRLFAIPEDARTVLQIRKGVQYVKEVLQKGCIPGPNYSGLLDRSGKIPEGFLPILDLLILGKTPELDSKAAKLAQPFMISVPTPILRVLAKL